jgi:hypothetical protein
VVFAHEATIFFLYLHYRTLDTHNGRFLDIQKTRHGLAPGWNTREACYLVHLSVLLPALYFYFSRLPWEGKPIIPWMDS